MYIYDTDVCVIKKVILDQFDKNIYNYKETIKILKEISKTNKLLKDLFMKHSDIKVITHLVRSAVYQLSNENKIIKYNSLRGYYILDDFDPIDKFIELEIDNTNYKNNFFIDTALSYFLKQDNQAILPNLRKICLPVLFEENPELVKYEDLLQRYFNNYIFFTKNLTIKEIKKFVMIMLETNNDDILKFKKYSISKSDEYFDFIKNKYQSLFRPIIVKHKIVDVDLKNNSLNSNSIKQYLSSICKINIDVNIAYNKYIISTNMNQDYNKYKTNTDANYVSNK
ncbi:MAG: hypothetical protein RSE26_01560 [Malacoplasma sp.]